MQGIPPTKDTDAEDVAWGLQTAASLWTRGELGDALTWLRRAAQAASEANDDDRALELARIAAELADYVGGVAAPLPSAGAPLHGEEEETTALDAIPAARDMIPEHEPSVLPAERVHAGMFDPWADPSAAPAPEPAEPPRRQRNTEPIPKAVLEAPSRQRNTEPIPKPGQEAPPRESAEVVTSVAPASALPVPSRPSPPKPPPVPSRKPPPLPPRARGASPKKSPSQPAAVEPEVPEIDVPIITEPPPAAAPPEPPAPPAAPPPEPPSPGAAQAEAPALDLEDVEAFSDLPDDARGEFARVGEVHVLAEGEEVAGFALAYVLEGAFDVAATMVDAPAVRLNEGAVLRARGTTNEGVPMRMISSSPRGVVATWSDAAVEAAFSNCPWVEDDLRAASDRVMTLVGITIGPLGERIDQSIREEIVGRLTVRPLLPGEVVVEKGQSVPGLLLVGVGELELVDGEEVKGVVGSGDFLFATEVLGAGAAPQTARAGSGGALVMFGDRHVAQELMVTCPPLLEVFAGM